MKISDLLEKTDYDQIADLWGVFIEKIRGVIETYNYMNSLEFNWVQPIPPENITLESLTEYIMASREWMLAHNQHKDQKLNAIRRLESEIKGMEKSILVLDAWIFVDDYAVMFCSEGGNHSYSKTLASFGETLIVEKKDAILAQIQKDKGVS